MRSTLLAATMTATALCLSVPAMAAGGGGGGMETPAAKPVDPNFARAKAMIEARDYQNAMPLLQQVVQKDPKNADAYNLMGFATRSSGNAQGSLPYYQQALAIDPRHLGALEYAGTAYLILGQLPAAEQNLARLDQLCTFGCAEYRTLKAKIADYKAGKRPTN